MRNNFENYLKSLISENYIVEEAMNYSLLAKSKRLRPLLLLTVLKDLDINYTDGFACASAIEMIHTYSLIHDDLPAFDNDDYRRGKLTNHKMYNEQIAILAGDALLTFAFETVINSDYNNDVKVKLINYISNYAGKEGMIKGQQFDIDYENKTVDIEQLTNMQILKTGKLIALPLICGLIIANKEKYIDVFINVGLKLGLAFQIQDDILDVTANFETLGKKTKSDEYNKKSTFVTLLGLEKAKETFKTIYSEIYDIFDSLDIDFKETRELIASMENRNW
ncbi:MAG: polyprenyl synthetase family protein [Erysipelotrichia bacterium]|nr:polyprenyl synthetase family protein [Erysipelotrichia bacterium]